MNNLFNTSNPFDTSNPSNPFDTSNPSNSSNPFDTSKPSNPSNPSNPDIFAPPKQPAPNAQRQVPARTTNTTHDASNPVSMLCQAVKKTDVARVAQLVQHKCPVNGLTKKLISPLHYALCNPKMVVCLLKMKANPNIRDGHGDTPLHWIAAYEPKSMAAVQWLLQCKADIHSTNEWDHSIVQDAIHNNPPLAQILLRFKAKP